MTPTGSLFISGYLRSGTTLLEKILAQHDAVSMLSQPFPLLFITAKERYLRDALASSDVYPLGHLFGERRYANEDFSRYLMQWQPGRAELSAIFEAMVGHEWQWTRFSAQQLDAAFATLPSDGGFPNLLAYLLHSLAARRNARWFGCKEVTCEEFIPLLLDRGFRCFLTLRDPRDVIASLNHGRRIGGAARPTLFNIRAWRKSVAFALLCSAHVNFRWCRYEDLASDPATTMGDIAGLIDLKATEFDFDRLRDTSGAEWLGNSSHYSHHGVTAASIGTFRHILSPPVSAFIEATCLPELRLLGYETTLTFSDAARAIREFREPYPSRAGLESDEATAGNARLELERLERVTRADDTEAPEWFLSPVVHRRLRDAFARVT